MISVRGVVDRVGPTLLHLRHGGESATAHVTDVVIAERGRRDQVAAGDLVLGVSSTTTKDAVELVRHCGEHGAAAVLLKPPLPARGAVLSAARATGTALIEVHAAAAWAQLVWLLRTVLDGAADESEARGAGAPDATPAAGGLGDLFRMADAAAAVVDAPVTIEDANSRVLAYSARQDRTDPARVSTIMGRRVPDDVLARFRSRGVFRELSRGRSTIFVPAQPDGTLPRLIVPIRMGGELLGSMWAVVAGPVPDERAAAFADAAPVVALHLLRRRAQQDTERRRSAELVRAVLEGSGSVRLAAAELDLADEPHRVIAIDVETEDALGAEGMRLALWERITAGVGRQPAVTELHDVLYAVVPDRRGWPALRESLSEVSALSEVSETAGRRDGKDARPLVAAGAPAGLTELRRSRAQAEEALRLLRAGLLTGPVTSHEQAWTVLVLHRAAVACAGEDIIAFGPLPRLQAHDSEFGTRYVDTLYEWLRHPGDPRAASKTLGIHPNTLRYRMARLTGLLGEDVDLSAPDVRLALLSQLVVVRWQ